MKISYLLIIMFVLLSQVALAANCDCVALNNKISTLETENYLLQQINQSYSTLLPQYNNLTESYEMLQKEYEKVKSERDMFEEKYLNTSLGNMTIGDFIIYMNNIENHYNSINQSISNQINQMTTIRNWTIGINLSLALFSITFVIFSRKIRKYILNKITKVKVKHETKINIE